MQLRRDLEVGRRRPGVELRRAGEQHLWVLPAKRHRADVVACVLEGALHPCLEVGDAASVWPRRADERDPRHYASTVSGLEDDAVTGAGAEPNSSRMS